MTNPISAPPIPGELRIAAGRLDITGEIVQDKTLTVQHALTPDMLALVKAINEPITMTDEREVGMATYVIRPKQHGRYKGVRRMKDQPIRVAHPGSLFYAVLTVGLLAVGLTVQINPILWSNPFFAVASLPALILGGYFLALALFPNRR
jgi:hypothetical protein